MNITISGKVIQGKKKGRELGFPTVNIELHKKVDSGVYAGNVIIEGKAHKTGIFVNQEGILLEAHIIGYLGDLYGKDIEVEIGKKIRDVIRFESEEELKKQIGKDINIISNS